MRSPSTISGSMRYKAIANAIWLCNRMRVSISEKNVLPIPPGTTKKKIYLTVSNFSFSLQQK